MLYKAKLVYSLIIFGPDDDVEIINEESKIVERYLKNKGDFKNKYDLRYKDKLEMVTISKMKTTSTRRTTPKMRHVEASIVYYLKNC